ncbi:MAG TPA: hypothetical protein VGM70_09805 [Pseudolysinimonas sp.]|jgi:hypothetical protein
MTRAVGMLVAGLVALAALTGCSAPAARPADLAVKVYQLRSDYAIRGAQIEITNRGSSDLTITSATFSSAWFAKTVTSPSTPNPLLAKSTVDFRVVLADGRCDAPKAAPLVRLRYTRADGSTGAETVTPTIPFESISVVHAQDCSQEEFEKVAAISIAPQLRFDPVIAPGGTDTGQHAALVDVTFAPTGAPGSVTLRSTEDTTLLAQREGPLRTIDLTLTAASPPTTITLDYVPEGCLQHRIAEDKIGTLIPMRVDAGPYTGALFSVAVSPAMKNALMDWVGVYCGW